MEVNWKTGRRISWAYDAATGRKVGVSKVHGRGNHLRYTAQMVLQDGTLSPPGELYASGSSALWYVEYHAKRQALEAQLAEMEASWVGSTNRWTCIQNGKSTGCVILTPSHKWMVLDGKDDMVGRKDSLYEALLSTKTLLPSTPKESPQHECCWREAPGEKGFVLFLHGEKMGKIKSGEKALWKVEGPDGDLGYVKLLNRGMDALQQLVLYKKQASVAATEEYTRRLLDWANEIWEVRQPPKLKRVS